MKRFAPQMWLSGMREFMGFRPRKPKRVRASLEKRDQSVQSLEVRTVLSAVSVTVVDAGGQQRDSESSPSRQEAGNSRVERLRQAAQRMRENRLQRLNTDPVNAASHVGNVRAAERQQTAQSEARANSSRATVRRSLATQSRTLQTSSESRSITTNTTTTTTRRPRVVNTEALPAESLRTRLTSTVVRSERLQSSVRATPPRLNANSLQNSALFRSTQTATTRVNNTPSTIVRAVESRETSPVKRYVDNLKNRRISWGIHQAESFESRIARATKEHQNRLAPIARPSEAGFSSAGWTNSEMQKLNRFWARHSWNHDTDLWRATRDGV